MSNIVNKILDNAGCIVTIGYTIVVLYTITAWVVNLVKLIKLLMADDSTTKHIIIHAIGIFPGISWITAWF